MGLGAGRGLFSKVGMGDHMQKSAEQAMPDPLYLLAPSGMELNVAGPLVPAGGARTEAGTGVLPVLIRCVSENHTECTRSSHQPGQPGR